MMEVLHAPTPVRIFHHSSAFRSYDRELPFPGERDVSYAPPLARIDQEAKSAIAVLCWMLPTPSPPTQPAPSPPSPPPAPLRRIAPKRRREARVVPEMEPVKKQTRKASFRPQRAKSNKRPTNTKKTKVADEKPIKRRRRKKTQQQMMLLKNYFDVDCKPSKMRTLVISENTNLTEQEVSRWFRNERHKSKKASLELANRSASGSGGSDDEEEESSDA